jgi:hypothetical protein
MSFNNTPPAAIWQPAIRGALCLVFWAASVPGCNRLREQPVKDFGQRHTEATVAIQRAYAYYRRYQRWPSQAEMEAGGKPWLPPKWQYVDAQNQGGPVLWLHGPEHMILSYRFAPPQQDAVNRTWAVSFEGDKRTFPADVDYSPSTPPVQNVPP